MEILKKPVLTEKVTILTDKLNQYVFLVDLKANKLQIKSAVEKMYGVSVEAVNTMRYAGKRKARGTRRRSEEHTSELQSLMRTSYAVFCFKKKHHNTYTVY